MNHNASTGLQGGASSEYFHLTNNEHDLLTNNGDAESLHFHDEESVTTPVTNNSAGVLQEWKYSAGYFHDCVATNTWVRTPVETVFTT